MNNDATWATRLELDDYEAVPAKIISPLHVYFANRKNIHEHSGVVFLQVDGQMPVKVWAARSCFGKMPLHELKTLADEEGVQSLTPDLLGHLQILINTIIPGISQDVSMIDDR